MLKNQIYKMKFKFGQLTISIATNIFGPFFWKLGIVFLTKQYANPKRIGEMALQIDLYIKNGILGCGPSARGILLARDEDMANLCLMTYWSRYIRVISHPLLRIVLRPLAMVTQYNTMFIRMPDGTVMHENRAIIGIQKRWETEERAPLLVISCSHRERGRDSLEQLGVPRGAWFVCLHVRESGFLNEKDDSYHAYRNADITTYTLAIKTIIENGGWIIRLGDPTAKPFPPMDHVLDYAHSEVRSDWMDIFCCAECRFFLGSTSGLFVVSNIFGVPCALANYIPLGARPWSGKDIFISKLCWSTTEERYLTFEEALAPDLRYCYDGNFLTSKGIRVVDNTPEEINDMVLEMLNRLNNDFKYTEEDERLQDRFNALLPYNKYGINSRMGYAFLHKYAWLLPDNKNIGDESS